MIGRPAGRVNLLQSSMEARANEINRPSSGRTLQDAIDVSNPDTTELEYSSSTFIPHSSLDHPLLLAGKPQEEGAKGEKTTDETLSLTSKFEELQKESADATRTYIDLRDEYCRLKQQIHGLKRSLELQEKSLVEYSQQRNTLLSQNGAIDAVSKMSALDEVNEGEQNANRVIAQLNRQLSILQTKEAQLAEMQEASKLESKRKFKSSQSFIRSFRDPFYGARSKKTLIQTLIGRPSGVAMLPLARNIYPNIPRQVMDVRKNVTTRRLSFAATINTHLAYPIYCLRFDRTGRYFITGADDYLSRVYCLSSHVRSSSKSRMSSDPLHLRGAVLVCTLRGHAGVINDISVSSDNAFLATASEDGDCRVWGLRDGSPIAILRGHTGGANMASWSTLTPYRLVTAGADGYARCWDIREACLIRYGGVVGKRFEYKKRKSENKSLVERAMEEQEESKEAEPSLPPIPARAEAPAAATQAVAAGSVPVERLGNAETGETGNAGEQVPVPQPPLPPLPPGQEQLQAAQAAPSADQEENEPGRFVAGDEIDEGVKLLSKMQHGASIDERMAGHGTRSRRASVKVLCVDVCPLGKHVATGADDGICRIFSAHDDVALERLDYAKSKNDTSVAAGTSLPLRQSRRQLLSGKLLLTLKGHLSAITDLKYSYGGDRLLSASQRDGVVRIWSWSGDTVSSNEGAMTSPSTSSGGNPSHVSHILIKLTNPEKTASNEVGSRSNRQRPSRTASTPAISCDVAAWVKDDSKVLTSQCELVKQTSSEIQPGSQYIFVWDSFTGQCLLGIRGAHTMQCPVVLPHPMLPSMICSAGADGIVKMWDLDKGECILEHKNTVDFGPVEARDRGMISGYLDGSFSPDGTEVVLTDDCGRVTVLDCIENTEDDSYPGWMREQYFANDYYELMYDRHGYCIERGSEQPPHLAPRGVRCTHSGAPWSEDVNSAFKSLAGPLPDPENESFWTRMRYRQLSRFPQKKMLKRNVVTQFVPNTTILIGMELEKSKVVHVQEEVQEAPRTASSPRLSSNWRWRDYSDILREEGQGDDDEPDPDDDSYELNDTSNRRTLQGEDDDSDLGDFELDSPIRRSRRDEDPEAHRDRPVRNRQRNSYDDADVSSEDDLVEYMSSHNTPSGPYRADYDTHFFRLTTGVHSINRAWVHRIESSSAYVGRKGYCPQVGDVVVYIPRAHFDVISDFPTLSPPWQNWPDGAEWPVVRCVIRSLRYRFPYKDFFSKNRSIVVILTLEVNGIPELSRDRELPWPKPTFVDLPRRHVFEVSMFQTDASDFIIPIGLYTSRLADIESVFLRDDGLGRKVEAFYGESSADDADLAPYEGLLNGFEEEAFDSGDPNLVGSGYRSISVSWEDNDSDKLSPWEIALQDSSVVSEIERPRLTDAEKRQVRDALTHVRGMEDVEQFLVHPVNTERYTDYESRVENPMWLEFIRTRLDADYYASRLSVVYDVKLIRENSWKYNGSDDLTSKATKMYEKFCEMVLSAEELNEFREFEKKLEESAEQGAWHHVQDESAIETENTGVIRRSRRQTTNRSSLESLPTPGSSGEGHGGRRSQQRRGSSTLSQRRASEGSFSMLEAAGSGNRTVQNQSRRTRGSQLQAGANAVPAAPVIPLNSGNRGRTTRNSRGQQPNGRQRRQAESSDLLAASRAEEARRSALARAQRASARASLQQMDSSDRRLGSGRSQRAPTRGTLSPGSRRSDRLSAGHPSYAEPPEDGDMADSEREEMRAFAGTRHRPTRLSARAPSGSPRAREPIGGRRSRASVAASGGVLDTLDDEMAPRISHRSTRARRGHQGSDEDSIESQPADSSRRIRIRMRSEDRENAPTRAGSRRVSSPPSDSSDEEQPGVSRSRRTSRPSKRRRANSSDESDINPEDVASEESEDDDLDESAEEREATPTARKRTRTSPSRRSSRGKNRPAYEDPSSSEFGSDAADDDNDDDDDDSETSERKRPARNGRSKKKVLKKPPKKKAKGGNQNPPRPALESWPDIPLKKISSVGKEILDRLSNVDEDSLFAIPVAEAIPDLADDYEAVIAEPLDFRTIQEERLPRYRSITELQNDLITVFHNCIVFNGGTHEYGLLAQ